MREVIKKIWKNIMYFFTKIYLIDKNIFLVNQINKIPKYELSYSQYGQDSYILHKLFNYKNKGVFLDVGGNDPINCNNTYLFEKSGWTGIAIEPQTDFNEAWENNRKTELLNYVIGEENKKVNFISGGEKENGLSGVEGYNKVSKNNQNKIEKEQKRLDSILIERNINKVDLLSIDVEGYEMNVLKSIDFKRIDIKVIVIENNIGFTWLPIVGKYFGNELGNNNIRRFLRRKGYKQIARIMCDDVFVKN